MATHLSPPYKPVPTPNDNRAVSALFRVFGGADEATIADARLCASSRGMHLGEYYVLSILVPLTLFIAIGSMLENHLGEWPGWLLALPLTFLALNILPFALGLKSPGTQWWCTSAASLVWAIYHRQSSGVTGLFAYLWIGIGIMSLVASTMLAWQASMRWNGVLGISWRVFLLITLHAAAISVGYHFGWPWAIAGGAGIASAICWAILNPGCQWLGPVYQTIGGGEILITIDDGPDPHDTPVLLDLLDSHQTKAIFFMIGEKVSKYPELAREVTRRGHEIGNHTLTHPAGSFWCAGPWRTRREIEASQEAIEKVTGKKPRLFRAPVGHRNLFTHPICGTLGLEVMAWNRRGFDAIEKDPLKVLSRILSHLSTGDIVLLHEATPIAEDVLSGVLDAVVVQASACPCTELPPAER